MKVSVRRFGTAIPQRYPNLRTDLVVKCAEAYMGILVEQVEEFAPIFLHAGMLAAEHIK